MLRVVLIASALALTPTITHAQAEGDANNAMARETANVIIQAVSPNDYGDWRYRWDAVSIRVSRFLHWHIYEPDTRDRPEDAIVRRLGWIDTIGRRSIGVAVYGGDDGVTMMEFEVSGFNVLDLIAALRAEGAEVSFQSDYETYSEYVITPAGRAPALMTTRRTCPPETSARAQNCRTTAELTFTIE
jgi:hypothetical protein